MNHRLKDMGYYAMLAANVGAGITGMRAIKKASAASLARMRYENSLPVVPRPLLALPYVVVMAPLPGRPIQKQPKGLKPEPKQ